MGWRRLIWRACASQVLGRNLEALITRAEELKRAMEDDFTSVEHLVLAFPDDARFGRDLLRGEGVDAKKLEAAVKDIRGSNRVTDQVRGGSLWVQGGRQGHPRQQLRDRPGARRGSLPFECRVCAGRQWAVVRAQLPPGITPGRL